MMMMMVRIKDDVDFISIAKPKLEWINKNPTWGPIASWMTNKFGWRITTVIGEHCSKASSPSSTDWIPENTTSSRPWPSRWPSKSTGSILGTAGLCLSAVAPNIPFLIFSAGGLLGLDFWWFMMIIMIVINCSQHHCSLYFVWQVLVWESYICPGWIVSPSILTRRGLLLQVIIVIIMLIAVIIIISLSLILQLGISTYIFIEPWRSLSPLTSPS